ncbi:YqeB family protein [Georgenia sunbinii]|uniref:YqeB family protein n=1 Tax=Georgenia sunbinii TaxID=3117728 RepID=UPI002F263926
MPTQVKQSPAVPAVLGIITAVVGAALGFALPPLARGLIALIERSPFPVPGIIDLVADLPLVWSVGVLAVLGVIAGAFVAHGAATEALLLRVADDHLEFRQEDREGWIERQDVAAVFRHGRHLVLLDRTDRVKARLDADALRPAAVQQALQTHGYPWHEQDPHEAAYLDWLDGRPGFTDEEHALLRRRHRERKDRAAREQIDVDLSARGLVARERAGKLQVRRAGSRGSDG